MINDTADKAIEVLFEPLRSRYQIGLEQSIKGSDFVDFDCVDLLHYKCHKINLNRGWTYMNSPFWIKNKKATKNPINIRDHKCLQYAATLALYHKEMGKI